MSIPTLVGYLARQTRSEVPFEPFMIIHVILQSRLLIIGV
jgi:hypothetical protein